MSMINQDCELSNSEGPLASHQKPSTTAETVANKLLDARAVDHLLCYIVNLMLRQISYSTADRLKSYFNFRNGLLMLYGNSEILNLL